MRKLKECYPAPTLLTLTGVTLWVLILNAAAILLGLTSWPIFFSSIFFFEMGATLKNAPKIFGGGIFGILCTWLIVVLSNAMTPALGFLPALLIPLLLAIAIIIMCGPLCPVLCNNVAFAYLTIYFLQPELYTSFAQTMKLIAVFVVGGLIMVLGANWICTAAAKHCAPSGEGAAAQN